MDFSTIEITSKSTWNRRGNSSKIGLQRIDVISTSNPHRFDVVCPLESLSINDNLVIEISGVVCKKNYSSGGSVCSVIRDVRVHGLRKSRLKLG